MKYPKGTLDGIEFSVTIIGSVNNAHASLEEGAKMAAAAGVKTLIITHLSGTAIDLEATKEKIAEHFKGEVIIAEDFLTVSSDGKVFILE